MNLNTRILEYVVAIAEEKSISAAAEKLYVSQPSLSQSLIGLENSLGVKLFNRSTIPLRPTPAGETFVDAAIRILSIQRELENRLGDMAKTGYGTIVVGISSFRNSVVTPLVLPVFNRAYPNVHVRLIEETNENGFYNKCWGAEQPHPNIFIKL